MTAVLAPGLTPGPVRKPGEPVRRARLRTTGWERDLGIETCADPEPPTGDRILVEIEACGVCHRDCIDRDGRFKFLRVPVTPGHEAVGRVLAIGPQVSLWRVGDRVATLHRDHCGRCQACAQGDSGLCTAGVAVLGLVVDGGYASHLVASERTFYRADADLPAAHAAILHCTYGTAYRGLARFGRARSGQRVLVTGANGGVGAAAIQVAKALDTRVTAVIRNPAHESFVAGLGADEVVVATTGAIHKAVRGRFDIALECVGQPTFNGTMRALRPGGRIVVIGNVSAERAQLNLGYVILNSLHIAGSRGADERDMVGLIDLYRQRPWAIPVHAELDLAEADRGQRMVKAGGLRGRVVLATA